MAIRRFTGRGPKLTAQDIEKAEKVFGAKLPEDYKQFLLTINGGRPHPSYFQNDSVKRFYSLCPKPDGFDLLSVYQSLREHLPNGVMPIGCNHVGDEICLVLKGKYRGKVFFWDHEGGHILVDPRIEFPWLEFEGEEIEFKGNDWPGHPDMTLLADSFTEFLDSLQHISDEELDARYEKAKRDNAASKNDQ